MLMETTDVWGDHNLVNYDQSLRRRDTGELCRCEGYLPMAQMAQIRGNETGRVWIVEGVEILEQFEAL